MNKKEWFEEVFIDKITLALSIYPELALTSEQFIVVLAILWLQKNQQEINIENLSHQTKISKEKLNQILDILSTKKYLSIKTKKNRVEFSLQGLFDSETNEPVVIDENLFTIFEQEFGRTLSALEVETLAALAAKYPQGKIIEALRSALIYHKKSLQYIAKILVSTSSDDPNA